MAVGHLSYVDIPQAHRSLAVARIREQIRSSMIGNYLSQDQLLALSRKLELLDHWELGRLPETRPPTTTTVPLAVRESKPTTSADQSDTQPEPSVSDEHRASKTVREVLADAVHGRQTGPSSHPPRK